MTLQNQRRSVLGRIVKRVTDHLSDEAKEANETKVRRLELEALEPRILFSGSPAANPPPNPAPAQEPAAEAPAAESPDGANPSAATGDATSESIPTTVSLPGGESESEALITLDQESLDALAAAGATNPITEGQVESLGASAAKHWIASGLTGEQATVLGQISYQITDLGGTTLGMASGYTIFVDDDAAGIGWFVDSSPQDNQEFFSQTDSLTSFEWDESKGVAGVDLLTVLLHEQGHILGIPDLSEDQGELMGGILQPGQRHLPTDGQALGAIPGSLVGSPNRPGVSVPEQTSLSIDPATGALVIDAVNGTSANDFVLSSDGTDLTISDRSGSEIISIDGTGSGTDASVSFSQWQGGIEIHGGGGDDTLTIDYTNGVDFGRRAITFHGGGQDSDFPGDTLAIVGGTFASATYNYTNAHDGSIQISGQGLITYVGLEPVSSSINATDVTLNFSAVSETITVTDTGGGQTMVDSTAGEVTTFNHPTNSLTINAGDGNDIINVDSLDAAFAASLTIDGQGDYDVINLNSALTIGGNLVVSAEDISVGDAVSVNGNSVIDLNAGETIVMSASSSLLAASGAITLDATGVIDVNGGDITSADGDIQITTDGTMNVGGSGLRLRNGSVISTTSGAIDLSGTSRDANTSNNNNRNGIEIQDAGTLIQSVSGDITLNGTGAADEEGNQTRGVFLNAGATISTGSGAILIEGTGGATAGSNPGNNNTQGIQINGTVESAGTGDVGGITLRGTGGGQGDGNRGIQFFNDNAVIRTVDGDILLEGTGGGSSTVGSVNNHGIHLSNAAASGGIVSTGNATITLRGTGGNADDNNTGVLIGGNEVITSTGGDISVSGTGQGFGDANQGVSVDGAVLSTTGNITIDGTGGETGFANNRGVFISGSLDTSGHVDIEGTGGATNTLYRTEFSTGFEYSVGEPVVGTDSANLNGADGQVGAFSGAIPAGAGGDFEPELIGFVDNPDGGRTIAVDRPTADGSFSADLDGAVFVDGAHVSLEVATRRTSGNNSSNRDYDIVGVDATGNESFHLRVLPSVELQLAVVENGGTEVSDLITTYGGAGTNGVGNLPNVGATLEAGELAQISLELHAGGYTIQFSRDTSTFTTGLIPYNGSATELAGIEFRFNGGSANGQRSGFFLDNVQASGNSTAIGGMNGNDGVEITGTVDTTGSGTVTIQGTGGTGNDNNYGIELNGAAASVHSANGNIALDGTGGGRPMGGANGNDGIRINNGDASGAIVSTGTATITLRGTGGTGEDNNHGVRIDGGEVVTSVDGNISISGTGGGNGQIDTASGNSGVEIDGVVSSTGTALIEIDGTGGGTMGGTGGTNYDDNRGVEMSNANALISSVNGNISIDGTGGGSLNNGSGNNDGVRIDNGAASGAIVSTGTATVTIRGTGGNADDDNHGVRIDANELVTSVGGNISISGTGGSTGFFDNTNNNTGVEVEGSVTSTGTAGIDIDGVGGGLGGINNDNNRGVDVAGGALISSAGGPITLDGTGGGTTNNASQNQDGVRIQGGSDVTATGSSSIAVTGTGGGEDNDEGVLISGVGTTVSAVNGSIRLVGNSGGDADGVRIRNSAVVSSTGTGATAGTITMTGTGGTDEDDRGVEITDAGTLVTTVDANILIEGTGNGDGVAIEADAVVASTGIGAEAGTITINGTSNGGNNDDGVSLNNGASVTSIDGNIAINGTANADEGVAIQSGSDVSSAGTGASAANIAIAGTGGNSNGDRGIVIDAGSTIRTVDGDIQITGTSGADDGVYINSGASVSSTGSTPDGGTITITGTSTGNNDDGDAGVDIAATGSLVTSVVGAIKIEGTSAVGDGVNIRTNASVSSTGSATVTIDGTGGTGAGSDGISVTGDAQINSDSGDVNLNASDDLNIEDGDIASASGTANLNGGNTVTIVAPSTVDAPTINVTVDQIGTADPGDGGAVTIDGPTLLQDTTITGGDDADLFFLNPSETSELTVDGGDPTGVPFAPGDVLEVTVPNPGFAIKRPSNREPDVSAGRWDFSDTVFEDIIFTDIEGPGLVVANETYTVAEDNGLNIPAANGLLANDSEPTAADGALRVVDFDDSTLPLGSSLSVGTNGSFTFSPPANFNGTVTFTYTVEDGRGQRDVGTATIVVTPVNDPPVVNIPDLSYQVAVGGVLVINGITVTDIDALEGNGIITVSIEIDRGVRLSVTPFGGATATGNNTGFIIITGNISDVNSTFGNGLVVRGITEGLTRLTITANDGGNTGEGGVLTSSTFTNILVTPDPDAVPAPPVVAPPAQPEIQSIFDRIRDAGGFNAYFQPEDTFIFSTDETGDIFDPMIVPNSSLLDKFDSPGDFQLPNIDGGPFQRVLFLNVMPQGLTGFFAHVNEFATIFGTLSPITTNPNVIDLATMRELFDADLIPNSGSDGLPHNVRTGGPSGFLPFQGSVIGGDGL